MSTQGTLPFVIHTSPFPRILGGWHCELISGTDSDVHGSDSFTTSIVSREEQPQISSCRRKEWIIFIKSIFDCLYEWIVIILYQWWYDYHLKIIFIPVLVYLLENGKSKPVQIGVLDTKSWPVDILWIVEFLVNNISQLKKRTWRSCQTSPVSSPGLNLNQAGGCTIHSLSPGNTSPMEINIRLRNVLIFSICVEMMTSSYDG